MYVDATRNVDGSYEISCEGRETLVFRSELELLTRFAELCGQFIIVQKKLKCGCLQGGDCPACDEQILVAMDFKMGMGF